MKRDMDLIRRIVLAARDTNEPVNGLPDVGGELFAAHVQLLSEAGLVHAALSSKDMRPAKVAVIWRLTWAGQDFADSIVSDTLWKKAKDHVIKPSASWSFDVLLEYIKFEIRRTVGFE